MCAAELDRTPECFERIFRPERCAATVRKRQGALGNESMELASVAHETDLVGPTPANVQG
jgi:hypothetical protein